MRASFNEWILRQTDRQDEVGQLARFIRADDCWPSGKPKVQALHHHIAVHDVAELHDPLTAARAEWRCARGFGPDCQGDAA